MLAAWHMSVLKETEQILAENWREERKWDCQGRNCCLVGVKTALYFVPISALN